MNFCQSVFLGFFSTSCQNSHLLKTTEAKDFHSLTMYSDHDSLPIPENNKSTVTKRGTESNNGALLSLQKATARNICCVILSIITAITKSQTVGNPNKRTLFIRVQDFGTHNIKKKTVVSWDSSQIAFFLPCPPFAEETMEHFSSYRFLFEILITYQRLCLLITLYWVQKFQVRILKSCKNYLQQ